MSAPLSRRQLDKQRCAHGCDGHPLNLHQVCHPGMGLFVSYNQATGLLELRCAYCGKPGPKIAVAEDSLS